MIRSALVAALAVVPVAALAVPAVSAQAAGAGTPYRVVLPKPTGPNAIGTTEVRLVDQGRADPWVPERRRELMISLWYPTRPGPGPKAPYAGAAVAPALAAQMTSYLRLPGDRVDLAASTTDARLDADPVGRHPVVLYSPASAASRVIGTSQAEELASQGFVVVTVDHTGEIPVEFPGGRVEGARVPWEEPGAVKKATDTRVADMRFVLDSLPRLPERFSRAMDLRRVGMVGFSMGGSTAASTMLVDRRIDAGVNLDGGMYDGEEPSEAARTGLDRPFLLYGAGGHSRSVDPTWSSFWSHQRGWKRELLMATGGHGSFSDYEFSLPGLARASGLPREDLDYAIGTIDSGCAVGLVRRALDDYFGHFLER